jgi:hypothetical protein
VPARGKALVPTDLSIAIPEGTYARIGECSFSLSLLSASRFLPPLGCSTKCFSPSVCCSSEVRPGAEALHRRGRRRDRRGLPRPRGGHPLQPLGRGLCRQARRPHRADDHRGDRDAGGRGGGGPGRHCARRGRVRIHRRLSRDVSRSSERLCGQSLN